MKNYFYIICFLSFNICNAQDVYLEFFSPLRATPFGVVICTESKTLSLMYYPGLPELPSSPFIGQYNTINDTSYVFNHDSTAKVVFTIKDSILSVVEGYESLVYSNYKLGKRILIKEPCGVPRILHVKKYKRQRKKMPRSQGLFEAYEELHPFENKVVARIEFDSVSCRIIYRGSTLLRGKYTYKHGKVIVQNPLGKNIVFYTHGTSIITTNQIYYHASEVVKIEKCKNCNVIIK